MKKYIYILLILSCLSLSSVSAIEEIPTPHSGFSEMSDYTGEKIFKSSLQLNEEKDKQAKELQTIKESHFIDYDEEQYSKHGSMPPIKLLRYKYSKYKQAKEFKKNGVVEKVLDPESVEAKEAASIKETQAVLNCKTMRFYSDRNELEATGKVSVFFPAQKTTLKSDRMIYDRNTNMIKAYDNVELIRDDKTVYGDFMQLDMDSEVSFLTNIKSEIFNFDLHAEDGYMYGDDIISNNGQVTSTKDNILKLDSRGFGDSLRNMFIKESDKSTYTDITKGHFVIKVQDINIKAKKAHDTITLKKAVIYKNDKKIVSLPSATFYTNKEQDYVEGNYPELGSFGRFGMFAGPGLVLETPFGSTFKILPTVNYKDKFGFGGIGRFKSATNITDVAYSTASHMLVVRGEQKLDDNLKILYGSHSYLDDWFLGRRWVKYGADLIYEKGYEHKNFIAKDLPMTFRHRFSAGFMQEDNELDGYSGYDKSFYDKNKNPLTNTGIGTARFKYMAEAAQSIYKLSDENTMNFATFDVVAQGSAGVYGTGDTQFIGRIGPRLTTQYKYWMQEMGYYLSAYEDNTPMPMFDSYRYGKQNFYVREYLRVHKLLTVGWFGSVNLSNDSEDRRSFQESTFFAAVGPDDLKLNVGFDAFRQTTYFGFTVAMNTKNSILDYKKMQIKNSEALGKSENPNNSSFVKAELIQGAASPLKRAVVTDLEDGSLIKSGERL